MKEKWTANDIIRLCLIIISAIVLAYMGIRGLIYEAWPVAFIIPISVIFVLQSAILLLDVLRRKENTAMLIVILLVLSLGGSIGMVVWRRSAAKTELLGRFRRTGIDIEHDFRKNRDRYSPAKIERMRLAAKVLTNKAIDEKIVIYVCELRNDANNICLVMKYVDEKERACQVDYSAAPSDVNDTGEVFLTPSELPKPFFAIDGKVFALRTGGNTFSILLKRGKERRGKAGIDERISYWEVNQTMCESILSGTGQFLLLDSKGLPLSRIALEDTR